MVTRKHLVSALSVGCSLLIASQSVAATIEPGLGNLSINRGQGFKPVTSRINANTGDSVMVGPGGSATVLYDDGCKVDVRPGAVTTIAPLSPCTSGSNAQQWPWECPPYDPAHPTFCGANWGFWAVFGAGLGFIIFEITRPSSP